MTYIGEKGVFGTRYRFDSTPRHGFLGACSEA